MQTRLAAYSGPSLQDAGEALYNAAWIRAYASADGSIVWTYDTNRTFETVNHVAAHGGSMNGPAPVVVGGMLYVSSGYGAFGSRTGNVLLAFGVQ